MLKDMASAPTDGSHFLALQQIGVDGTDRTTLEWREIWYEPKPWFLGGSSMWAAEAGEAQFGADCFVGWIPLPPKR